MRTGNLLLASLLVALYGCQPETPAQPPAEPAMAPPVTAAPVEPAAPAAMMPAPESVPAQSAEPVPAAKPTPAVQEKPAAVKQEAAPAKPVTPASAAPAVKVEAAPAAKPEAKAVPSEVDAMGLAKKSGCLVCHSIDKKLVGPAWKDVAAKYRGDAGAEARLMDKIARGGSGVWGGIAMPPNAKLGEADRQALARFVLSLK